MTDTQTAIDIVLHGEIAVIYRKDSRKVFATLIRLLGDFDVVMVGLRRALQGVRYAATTTTFHST